MLHVSFAVVLTALTLALTVTPVVVIWVMFSNLLDASDTLLANTTAGSIDTLATNLQEMYLTQAMQVVTGPLSEGQNMMAAMEAFVHTTPLLSLDLRPPAINVQRQIFDPYLTLNFGAMKGNTQFAGMNLQGVWVPPGTTLGYRTFAVYSVAMDVDVITGALGHRTLYMELNNLSADGRTTELRAYYLNQVTGGLLLKIKDTTYPASAPLLRYPMPEPRQGWSTDLGFNSFTGLVEVTSWSWLPCQNDTWIGMTLEIDASTMSQDLAAQLVGYPTDRLFILWNQPHGHMLAASNGMYWSQSDVNWAQVNPLRTPPNIAAFELWTCLNSTDLLIYASCVELWQTYQSWTAIPDLQTQMTLNGTAYWVAVGHSNVAINITIVMLKDRATVMGAIDASQAAVGEDISRKKTVTYIIIAAVTFAAVSLPLTLGVWLGTRLLSLAAEMDGIAKLQFDSVVSPPTVFHELHRFQASFHTMERGLHAFSRFVPQAVVKVLMAGKMKASQSMTNQMLTIMFADIEGFSTICEAIPAEELAEVCTQYFEVMCSILAEHHGTIDKFVGDCIMGLWNAPTPVKRHEQHAVRAALAMQQGVLSLHASWRSRRLPELKFRLGIHTGTCLVGNFGCSFRVSYTCLGDSVNLAARLEALNKKFGTYVCISHTTYEGCAGRFECRRLAKVTVPGKAEVLPVYEALCPADGVPDVTDLSDGDDVLSAAGSLSAVHLNVLSGNNNPAGAPGTRYNVLPATRKRDDTLVYHWQHVDRSRVLDHRAAYHAAYDALVAGDLPTARRWLAHRVKAWDALEAQLKQQPPDTRWDGVFYFKEK